MGLGWRWPWRGKGCAPSCCLLPFGLDLRDQGSSAAPYLGCFLQVLWGFPLKPCQESSGKTSLSSEMLFLFPPLKNKSLSFSAGQGN